MTKSLYFTIVLFIFSMNSFGQVNGDYEIVEYFDISYLSKDLVSNDSLQRLNFVIPVATRKVPLFIWIGGGAWSYVDRNREMDLARMFAKRGFAVASIGHRLSPATWKDSTLSSGIQHPKHMEDIAASVKWLYDHADDYGYDSESIFIGGFSSGAHLASLVSVDPTYLNKFSLSHNMFKGVIPIGGTYDIIDYHKTLFNSRRPELARLHVEAVFGSTESDFVHASPVTYLENLSSPILLISDNNMYNYSKLFEERIRETDFRDIQVVYSYDLSHDELWKDLSFSEKSVYREIIVKFIESKLE